MNSKYIHVPHEQSTGTVAAGSRWDSLRRSPAYRNRNAERCLTKPPTLDPHTAPATARYSCEGQSGLPKEEIPRNAVAERQECLVRYPRISLGQNVSPKTEMKEKKN